MVTVSIITVCLNASGVIETAIESVRSQTYPDIEHIVIDGGSTDGTLDIIEKYIDSISYFVSEPDRGIYNAMNKGIDAATGDIIFFLNSDDRFFDDGVVKDIADVFNSSPDIDIVFGNQIFVYARNRILKKQSFEVMRHQLAKTTILHQSLFTRRKVFGSTNGFSENYQIVSDYEWVIKAFLIHKFRYFYVDRTICVVSGQGISSTTDFEKERITVMRKYFTSYEILRCRVVPQMIRKIIRSMKRS